MDYSITSKLSVHSALNGVKLPIIWPLLKSFSIKQFCGKLGVHTENKASSLCQHFQAKC